MPKSFSEVSAHSCKSIIRQICNENALLDIVGMLSIFGADGEPSLAVNLSGLSIASVVNSCEDGKFVPEGGMSCIIKVLKNAILSSGGVIMKDASVQELIIEANKSDQSTIRGVKLYDGANVTAKMGVVSGLGILCTYCNLLPPSMVGEKNRAILKEYVELWPKLLVLFEVRGSKEDLGLSDVEYLECGGQVCADRIEDENDCLTRGYVKVWCPTVNDDTLSQHYGGGNIIIVEMCADSTMVKATEFSGFSNVTPLLNHSVKAEAGGPILFSTNTKHHPNKSLGYPILLSDSSIRKIKERATLKMLSIYPNCQDNVVNIHVEPPFMGGHRISANSGRYIGAIKPEDADVQGLYLCSEDLSVPGMQGELQAGYLGVCAALNYSCSILRKRILSSLQ